MVQCFFYFIILRMIGGEWIGRPRTSRIPRTSRTSRPFRNPPKTPILKAITKNKKYEENSYFFTDDGIIAIMSYGTANTAETRAFGRGY